jgi:ribonucleotide monophosphatase NagD (HAD superfamily)
VFFWSVMLHGFGSCVFAAQPPADDPTGCCAFNLPASVCVCSLVLQEFATGCPAVVLGKPAADVFQLAAQTLGLNPEQVVMVGDDVIGDVGGAQGAGCQGVLVRTGKYREGDEQGPVTPHAVLPSVAALPEWLEARLAQ